MPFKLNPRARAFANRAKEVWRSTHLTIKALPFVGALSLVYFSPPVNVERSPVQVLTKAAAKEMLVDNWARTDRIISRAASGDLTGQEYADHLNEMYWFDTLSSYNYNTWEFKPVLNERFGTFYYFDSKKNEIRQVNMHLDQVGAIETFKKVLSTEQISDLAGVFASAAKRLGTEKKELEYASRGPVQGDNVKGYVFSQRFSDPSKAYMASRLFAGDIRSVLSSEELERMRKIVVKTPPEKIETLVAEYKDLNRNYDKSQKSVGTFALLALFALGSAGAASKALKSRASDKSLSKTARRITSQGESLSPFSVLKQHVGPFYASLLSIKKDPQVLRLIEQHLDEAAQARADAALATLTNQDVKRAQPSNADKIRDYLTGLKKRERPLLYGFWGVGEKESADSHDAQLMERLSSLSQNLEANGLQKPRVKIIFADTHGEMNGFAKDHVDSYYQGISALAKAHGLEVVRLSRLEKSRGWRKAVRSIGSIEAHVSTVLANESVKSTLLEGANKHSQLVAGGSVSPQESAETYARKRIIEGRVLEKLPGWKGIHFAFADPHVLGSLMNLPTVFLYPREKGSSEVPWFTRGGPLHETRKPAYAV